MLFSDCTSIPIDLNAMSRMSALQSIFEKIVSKDKDYRYMATSDLLNELQRETLSMDSDVEKKICQVRRV